MLGGGVSTQRQDRRVNKMTMARQKKQAHRKRVPHGKESSQPDRETLALAEEMYVNRFRGNQEVARNLRRRLLSRLRRILNTNPRNVGAWVLLGDTYEQRPTRIGCYQQALSVSPRDAEAHAELALLLAKSGDRRYARHCDMALRNCRGSCVEDDVIYRVLSAANAAEDSARARRAIRIGKARFPRSRLFKQ